jgi:putative ABC transport system permease protein
VSFIELIVRNLIRQRVRTALTVLGISIGIMTVVTLGVITEGMKATMSDMLRAGGADFLVAQQGAADLSFSTVTTDEWQQVAARDDVLWAHGQLMHVIRVGSNPFFVLSGIRPADLAESPPELVAGQLLPAGAPDAIVLGEGAAGNLGATVGDTVTLDDNAFHVVGIYRTGTVWQDNGAFAELGRVQDLAGKPGIVTMVYVKVVPGADPLAVAAGIESSSEQVAAITSVADFGEVDQGSQMIDSANLAISILAVGIGAIGVMNTMIMSVFERTREIGILRAVGWSGRRILRLILGESLILCLIAAAVGLLLGVLATRALLMVQTIGMFLEPQYSLAIALRALGVAIIVAIAGAVYPSLRAVRLTPMEALRHE